MYFRINYSDDGKKHGECSLFNSLEFPSYEPTVSTNENQMQNNLPLVINNVTLNNEQLSLPENAMVC